MLRNNAAATKASSLTEVTNTAVVSYGASKNAAIGTAIAANRNTIAKNLTLRLDA